MEHIYKTFNNISKNQWCSLIFSLIASTLVWLKLIFIISPQKNNKIKIGKYQIYALIIGCIITLIYWIRLLLVIDPLNNK